MDNRIVRNLKKDLLIEFRNRSAVNISFAFAGITTLSVSLVAGGISLDPKIHGMLLWIIIFFSGMSGLAHIFIREEEEKNILFLMLHCSPEEIYLSKLIFNIVFFLCITSVICPLYLFFLQAPVAHPGLFASVAGAGSIAIASCTTILGAMVSRAGGKSSLFTVISFPLLLPVIWVSTAMTAAAMESTTPPQYGSILFLLAFSGLIISISYLLFRYIWTD